MILIYNVATGTPVQQFHPVSANMTSPVAECAPPELAQLLHEHRALMRQYGEAQLRCSQLVAAQAAEIARLQVLAMRLRAEVVLRDTALAWVRHAPAAQAHDTATGHEARADDLAGLEASLVAADLVICQTGCVSHNAYWREQDHCRRTGKTCVLVAP